MKVKDITSVIEEFAPLSLQESYDNSGLIVGSPDTEVNSALICVDITEAVLEEAVGLGCDMIISHHPILFSPLKKISDNTYIERVVVRAIKNDIVLYASHTNLDSATEGMSWRLAEQLGISNLRTLSTTISESVGFGVIGTLPEEQTPEGFLRKVRKQLHIGAIRHNDFYKDKIRKVALCTGSGGSLIEQAIASGADIYLSADFKYNNFLDADERIIIADIGHFESEYCSIDLLYDIITKKIPTFALYKSHKARNPINYLV